jgi:putative FmdB family regulatory protein
MILYDYYCLACKKEFEELKAIDARETTTCPSCGALAKQTFTVSRPMKDWAEGIWEDLTDHPIYVRSRRHLRELCKQFNCYTHLDDGYRGA